MHWTKVAILTTTFIGTFFVGFFGLPIIGSIIEYWGVDFDDEEEQRRFKEEEGRRKQGDALD